MTEFESFGFRLVNRQLDFIVHGFGHVARGHMFQFRSKRNVVKQVYISLNTLK